jgi:hypothetical protein
MTDDTVQQLRDRMRKSSTDGARIHALFELLEHADAQWSDVFESLDCAEPVSTQAAYHFHRLLKVSTVNGRAIKDPAFWTELLAQRAVKKDSRIR